MAVLALRSCRNTVGRSQGSTERGYDPGIGGMRGCDPEMGIRYNARFP